MGCCSSCFKSQDEGHGEGTPLVVSKIDESQIPLRQMPPEQMGKKYYDSIIDDANNSFLNLSVKRKNNITQGVDKLRSAFQGTVPENLYAISPPSSATIEKFGNPDIINQQRSVINVLSESNSNSDQFEAAADEIAQLISQHTGNVGVNEEGAAFVKFQSTRSHR